MKNYDVSVLLSSLLVSAIAYAPAANAALPDILEQDLDAAERAIANDAQDEAALRAESGWEETGDLFPEIPVETKGALEERKESRTGDLLTVTVEGKELVFKDVPIREWFAPYVRVMAEAGVISGYKDENGVPLGLFKPGNPVSVEELAKILVVQSGMDMSSCAKKSRNATASGSWSASYVACAESGNWTIYSDGTVDVKRAATRAEVIATVLEAYRKEPAEPKGTAFKDVPASMQFAGSVERAKTDGVVIGYTDDEGNALGLFGPGDDVKRAELAKMLTIADEIYGD